MAAATRLLLASVPALLLLLAPDCCAQTKPGDAILRFRANGGGTIGAHNISIDGRGGGALGTPTTADPTTLALSSLTFPELKLAEWEELGQYRLIITADDEARDSGSMTSDFTRGTQRITLNVKLVFKICSYPFKTCETSEQSTPMPVEMNLDNSAENGTPLNEFGQARVVATVDLPKTGYILLDNYFSLPTKAVFEIETQLGFPNGSYNKGFDAKCRGGKSPFEAPSPLYFESLVSSLAIGTGLPPFQFDPAIGNRQPGGPGVMSAIADSGSNKGKATFIVDKDKVAIAPLEVLPAIFNISLDIPIIQINITIISDLTGTIDVCTGELEMLFDATFTPVVGNFSQTPLSVATTLTTQVSTGYNNTRTGTRINNAGECKLVGVAKVPVTDDAFENWILSLPNDAITEMPSYFTIGCAGVEQIRSALRCDEHA